MGIQQPTSLISDDDFINNALRILNGKLTGGDVMTFDQLKGYKPESPKEGGGFEALKYNGPVEITKSIISTNDDVDSEFYPKGCTMIEIEAVISEGEFEGRKLWKRFNLDDVREDKKGKTSLKKLADQLWAVGLSFDSLDTLNAVNEKFVGMRVIVKAWPVDFKDGRAPVQMWNVKSLAGATSTPTTKPSF